ncbi:DUF445 domain-containing protein [Scleromatobacter humisilvae]|uniref:DUF445 domain-containing protein n=1 Tax=Scleromatobacter humisilvae TaxID=2897159 RepID=A0A9X2C1T8_9BURK|nr:DUF445 domain-containing protein [Scleromatobacter humisilvae]MCK9689193.1 DUF445 domain-containing protein [Scleromatobacter humisilvae]
MNLSKSAASAAVDPRAVALKRMKWSAGGLLAAALAGLALAVWQGGEGAWAWIEAFCEASAVGAIADWFAVVALFRHPLGLPLPHTAIIPRNKARVADGLAHFVRDHFLDPQTLVDRLGVFDPSRRLADWLSDPARVDDWVAEARGWALKAVELFDDGRMRQATLELVVAQARRWNSAATAAEVLTVLTQGGRHHELLDAGLEKIGDFLAEDEVKARVSALMVRHARKEWPKVVGMVELVTPVARMADGLADKLSASVLGELREVLAQPDHPVRQRYDRWLAEFTGRLRHDEALVAAFERVKERAITDPAILDYAASVWNDIKRLLQADLADEHSALAEHVAQAMRDVGDRLRGDEGLRASLNEHLLSAAGQLAANLRGGVTEHIAQTIKDWDDRQLVDELELSVGKDLQFIRINGAIVGGLAGLALHALRLMLH